MNSAKIYIDCGAYDGDSIKEFLNWYPEAEQFKIYAIEPNPEVVDKLKRVNIPMKIIEAAAWVADGEAELAQDKTATPMGSTLMPSKSAIWDNYPKIKVRTFDFSAWIKQFDGSFVVVKMDIEGAEFKILPKMINDGTHIIMDLLLLETHPNKVRDYTTTASDALFKRLSQEIEVRKRS